MIDRSVPPKSYPLESINITQAQFLSLKERDDVMFISYHQQPIQIFELVFSCGRFDENVPGISFYAAKLLVEGTENKTSEELSSAFEYLGTFFEVTPGVDYVSFRLYCQRDNWLPSFRLLLEILTHSRLSKEEFDIIKSNRIENLKQQFAKPSQIATLEFLSDLFGTNHPYGRQLTPSLVKEVSYIQTKDFIQSKLFSKPKMVVIGDWTNEIENASLDLLNSINSVNNENQGLSAEFVTSSKREIFWPGATQSSIRIGSKCINPQHNAIHHFTIANTLLGGFFGSRLMKKIREEKGMTYGIYTSINHWKEASYWMLSTEIQKDKSVEAIEEIYATIYEIAHNAPSNDEVNILTGYLKGKLLASMDSVFNRASLYKTLWLQGLDVTSIQKYLEAINSITPEQISKSIKSEITSTIQVTVS